MPIDDKIAENIEYFAEKEEKTPVFKKKPKKLQRLRYSLGADGIVRHTRHPRSAQHPKVKKKKKALRPVGRPRKYSVSGSDLVPFSPPVLTGTDAAKAVQFRKAVHSAISDDDLQVVIRALYSAAAKGDTVAARLLLQYTVGRPEATESKQGPSIEVKQVILGTRAAIAGGVAEKEISIEPESVKDES